MENNIILQLKDIKKDYGSGDSIAHVLKGINLDFAENEFTAIIGPSGSGKTTLLNILGALDTPTSGSIIYKGTDISTMNPDELATFRNKALGFIFQFHHLLPEFTLKDNILIPAWIASNSVNVPEKSKRADELLEFIGLGHKKDAYISNLSGGQTQRGAIARSLINNPGIILADEPTGNLDSETTEQIYKLMREVNKEFKTSFIIVTHDLSLADKCDRVIKIMDGKIVEDSRR